jgi:hypothetical protein
MYYLYSCVHRYNFSCTDCKQLEISTLPRKLTSVQNIFLYYSNSKFVISAKFIEKLTESTIWNKCTKITWLIDRQQLGIVDADILFRKLLDLEI